MVVGRYLPEDELKAYKKEMERQRQKFLKRGIIVSSAKSIKLFDRKQYKLAGCFLTSSKAIRFAKMLRDRGDFARVQSYKEGHCVYWRLG